MLITNLNISGLHTNENPLNPQSPGALELADNCVIDAFNIIKSRRGFNYYGTKITLSPGQYIDWINSFQSKLLIHYGTTIAYDSDGAGTWSAYTGSFSPPTGAYKIHGVEGVNKNFYFTSSNGIYKIDTVTNSPYLAGVPQGLDGTAALAGSGSGWFNGQSNAAYHTIFGYYDANNNLLLGSPSEIYTVSNTGSLGTSDNVNVQFSIPSGLTTTYFWQLYRSDQTGTSTTSGISVPPGSNFSLCGQANLTSTNLTNKFVTFEDELPDSLRGALIYTDINEQGPDQTNDIPPLALYNAFWKGMMFYANITTRQQLYLTIDSIGSPSGIQASDTISFKVGATTLTYTASTTTQNPATETFKIITSGTVGSNIDASARNLVACINQDPSNSLIYAYYISTPSSLPGQILIQGQTIGVSAFSVTSTRGGAFLPPVPSSGTSYATINSNEPATLYVSKLNQPEAVPQGPNAFPIGAADQPILGLGALTDALYIFKADGIFRMTGSTPPGNGNTGDLTVTPTYPDTILLAPESLVVLDDSIYAYTDQGLVSVTQAAPQLIDFPIEDSLLPIQQFSNFNALSFGIAYPADRKYLFYTMNQSTDTVATNSYVYNYITEAWTHWTFNSTSGFMNPVDNKLYLGDSDDGFVLQERKTNTVADFADISFPVTITSSSGNLVNLSSTANCSIGWSLSQPISGADNPNFPNTSVITNIISGTQIQVEDIIGWDAGAAAVYEPILCQVTFAPAHGGFPLYLKHWGTLVFNFLNITAPFLTVNISSDLSDYPESFEVEAVALGWGQAPWGFDEWGSVAYGAQPTRILCPLNKAWSHWLGIGVTSNTALTNFELTGIAGEYNIVSTRFR